MESIDFQREIAEILRKNLEAKERIISLQADKIERMEKRIIDLEIDQNNTNKIREQKVWAVKLQIAK